MTASTEQPLSTVPLMQLNAGFWSFKTFATALELNLFTRLAGQRTVTLGEIAEELDIHERPADMFLVACASLGLLEKECDGYRNSALSEEFLVQGRPRYFGGFVRYCDQREYSAWGHLIDALRSNRPLTWSPGEQDSLFSAEDPVMTSLFWEAMHSMSCDTARTLGEVYDFTRHRRLLDVGGGSGAYPIELCSRYPGLKATVFDLEHVCHIAERKVREAGLDLSVSMAVGDFQTDARLPGGHDVVLLSSILHDWDEPTGRSLLRKCWEALEPGGVILISELLLNADRDGPPEAALMGLNMIVETEGDKNYSGTEYRSWLLDAGFRQPCVVPFEAPGANGAVVALK
ncbi:methyltransferase [Streptomyces sp. NPDC005876]|uniref:methyltransferase n=1 Tax=Streptomyces sp. NPDC005876 TaxID=3157076 RepID=UPI0033ED2D0C